MSSIITRLNNIEIWAEGLVKEVRKAKEQLMVKGKVSTISASRKPKKQVSTVTLSVMSKKAKQYPK